MRDGIWAVLLYGQHVALLALHLWWRLFLAGKQRCPLVTHELFHAWDS